MKTRDWDVNTGISDGYASYLGGKFSLFEKIKLGGIGSPWIVYLSGIREYGDFIDQHAGNFKAKPFLNAELFKGGILFRVVVLDEMLISAIPQSDILKIKIDEYEVGLEFDDANNIRNLSIISIELKDGNKVQFCTSINKNKQGRRFFQKGWQKSVSEYNAPSGKIVSLEDIGLENVRSTLYSIMSLTSYVA